LHGVLLYLNDGFCALTRRGILREIAVDPVAEVVELGGAAVVARGAVMKCVVTGASGALRTTSERYWSGLDGQSPHGRWRA